ncbi:MAG: response regulator [Armatimonadetes bacterium]|nr:response regulator [Armatimonadota bacterium]
MTLQEEYILIVEDDPDSQDALAMVLEGVGHPVVCASNGREALEQLHREPEACLIMLDLMMPEMDGWEFRRLQKDDPKLAQIPTIVVSALGDSDKRPNGDVVGYFTKPFDAQKLIEAVAKIC